MKSMDDFFLPHFSAYRAYYSTQHVLLCLIKEWKTNLDNNFAVGAVLMDFSKAFDCIPHNLLIARLPAYSFEGKLYFIFIHTCSYSYFIFIHTCHNSFRGLIMFSKQ